jgi:hypothetical protein
MCRRILASLVLLIGTAACAQNFQDITDSILSEKSELPLNVYYDLVWLSDNKIAVAYDRDYQGSRDNSVATYDLDSQDLADIPKPALPDYCIRGWNTGGLGRMSDGNLAFIYDCITPSLVDQYMLASWDPESNDIEELYNFRDEIFATSFSFSPSSTEFVQEDSTNISMGNRIFKVSLAENSMTQLVPNFVRAKVPSWSPRNNLIAFWGTESYPANSEDFKKFDEIRDLVAHPWDLYAMDENGINVRQLLPNIRVPGILRWSPSRDILAFGGTIRRTEGIWIFDPDTKNLIRVFDRNELFDWSLDGEQLIVVEHLRGNESPGSPIYAYVLELPKCVFVDSCGE